MDLKQIKKIGAVCPKCKGDGIERSDMFREYYAAQYYSYGCSHKKVQYIACKHCCGKGWLDWIEMITGVNIDPKCVIGGAPMRYENMDLQDISDYVSWITNNKPKPDHFGQLRQSECMTPDERKEKINDWVDQFIECGRITRAEFLYGHVEQLDMEEWDMEQEDFYNEMDSILNKTHGR